MTCLWKKTFTKDPELWEHFILGVENGPIASKQIFFQETIMIFMSLFFPFLWKIFKKSLVRIQSYDSMSFSAQNGSIAINQFFLWKKLQCNFDVPIGLFDRAKFSKNLKSRWVMAMHHFEPMAYFPWIFLEKTI